MKLLGSTKSKLNKDKNVVNVPDLEIIEVVLLHCNIINKNYEQDSRVLYTFVPNRLLNRSFDNSNVNVIFSKTVNSEFSYIEVWFTDRGSKPLEIEDKIIITLVINCKI